MKIRTIPNEIRDSIIQSVGYTMIVFAGLILIFVGIKTTFDYYVAACYVATIGLAIISYMTYRYKEYHFHLMYMAFWLVLAWSITKSPTITNTELQYQAVFLTAMMLMSVVSFSYSFKSEFKTDVVEVK